MVMVCTYVSQTFINQMRTPKQNADPWNYFFVIDMVTWHKEAAKYNFINQKQQQKQLKSNVEETYGGFAYRFWLWFVDLNSTHNV